MTDYFKSFPVTIFRSINVSVLIYILLSPKLM